MSHPLLFEHVWLDQKRYEDAECQYHQRQSGGVNKVESSSVATAASVNLRTEIKKVRENIKNTLTTTTTGTVSISGVGQHDLVARIQDLESENKELRKVTRTLQDCLHNLESRLTRLETGKVATTTTPVVKETVVANGDDDDDDDDEIDLFGSDEEIDAEAERLKQERVTAYTDKKSKKTVVAKSSVVLDVKPWDDETDMKQCEVLVRTIVLDGLIWGVSKVVPLAYGIMKLQIQCVVEDDKIGIDDLIDSIQAFEDFVQSVDVAAFNKI